MQSEWMTHKGQRILTAKYKKYILKEAVLGISGSKAALLEIVKDFSGVKPAAFDDLDKAKEWLAANDVGKMH